MVRTGKESDAAASMMPKSKTTTDETAKPRGVKKKLGEVGTAKGKAKIASKKKRTSDPQLRRQQAAIKAIKDKLKDVVERFETAYPDGVDFTPGAQDVDFLWGKIR